MNPNPLIENESRKYEGPEIDEKEDRHQAEVNENSDAKDLKFAARRFIGEHSPGEMKKCYGNDPLGGKQTPGLRIVWLRHSPQDSEQQHCKHRPSHRVRAKR